MEDLIALSMQIMRSKMQLSSHGQLLKILLNLSNVFKTDLLNYNTYL